MVLTARMDERVIERFPKRKDAAHPRSTPKLTDHLLRRQTLSPGKEIGPRMEPYRRATSQPRSTNRTNDQRTRAALALDVASTAFDPQILVHAMRSSVRYLLRHNTTMLVASTAALT